MSDCTLIREQMPLLLTESLGSAAREAAHQHIESCASCEAEWSRTREAWKLLADAADRPVPGRVRARFLDEVASMGGAAPRRAVVVPFTRRPVFRRFAQAAAIALIAGGAYFAGSTRGTNPSAGNAAVASVAAAPQFRISENALLSASQINPEITGTPAISNVRFIDHAGAPGEVGMTFDMTQKVTVTGKATDQSLVNLAAYVLGDSDHPTTSRSNAIQWVRDTYSTGQTTDPQIVAALASVLRNDAHEGVRLKAVETLQSLPPSSLGSAAAQARQALIEAVQNDPNTNVRLKAVEALAHLAAVPEGFDSAAVETLRKKASQGDENPYLRVKAAEALSQMNL